MILVFPIVDAMPPTTILQIVAGDKKVDRRGRRWTPVLSILGKP